MTDEQTNRIANLPVPAPRRDIRAQQSATVPDVLVSGWRAGMETWALTRIRDRQEIHTQVIRARQHNLEALQDYYRVEAEFDELDLTIENDRLNRAHVRMQEEKRRESVGLIGEYDHKITIAKKEAQLAEAEYALMRINVSKELATAVAPLRVERAKALYTAGATDAGAVRHIAENALNEQINGSSSSPEIYTNHSSLEDAIETMEAEIESAMQRGEPNQIVGALCKALARIKSRRNTEE